MKNFVYILKCVDGSLYTGSTNDLKKRVHDHNHSKRAAKYTRSRRPVKLVYFETSRTAGAALRREAEIKRLSRKQKIKLIKNRV